MIVNKKLACFTGLLALSGALLASCGGGQELNLTIKFESNGGSAVASQTVKFGQKATKPADPTKDNATFDGWFADKALKVAFDWSQEITADWTLYAGWKEGGAPATSSQEQSTPAQTSEESKPSTWTMTFIDAGWWNKDEAATSYTLEPASDGKGAFSATKAVYDTATGYDSVAKTNHWFVDVPLTATKIQFFRLGLDGVSDWGARTVVIDLSARNGKTTWALDNVASWFGDGKQATGNWVE